jgi:LmbE family N-acetylglucosaminyl deacetylase
MHDRLTELETFARPLDLQRYRRPLVLAPHPDDEVFGCGGLIALWTAAGVVPKVIVVTAGQAQPGNAAHAGSREDESRGAAALLGHELEFWGEADRSLRCDEALVTRLLAAVQAHQADVLLCPALCEPHPDHQALTLALACATARWSGPGMPDVLLYESGGGLGHADTLVDISGVLEAKSQALDAFVSQEVAQPYKSRIQARDHFRAMTLGPESRAAEAFQWVPCASKGWPAWVPALEPLVLHARGQAALPQDLPLVSVLVRTIGDAHLAKTLATVCAQTYSRLEVVVVAAHGQQEAPMGLPQRRGMPFRWVHKGRALNRPQAANAAMDAAHGEVLIFLDDDDLWTPEHVQKLVSAYRASGTVQAVHTDVRVIDEAGQERTRYDQPFVPARLAFTNVFPIHSVLFDRRLVQDGHCRFDEELPVLEDWDFWLQVTAHTDVLHVPGVSALYRWRDRSGLESEDSSHHQRHWRDRVQARWLHRWPEATVLQAIRWYTASLDEAQQRADAHALTVLQQTQAAAEAHAAAQVAQEQARALAAELQAAGVRLGQAVHDATAAAEGREAERLAREAMALQLADSEGARRQQQAEHEKRLGGLREDWAQERAAWMGQLSATQQRVTELSLELQGAAVRTVELHALADRQAQERAAALNALADRERQLGALQATTSWRITRPLRWLGAWLRGQHVKRAP